MAMKKLISIILFALCLISCSKETTPTVSLYEGEWEVKESATRGFWITGDIVKFDEYGILSKWVEDYEKGGYHWWAVGPYFGNPEIIYIYYGDKTRLEYKVLSYSNSEILLYDNGHGYMGGEHGNVKLIKR